MLVDQLKQMTESYRSALFAVTGSYEEPNIRIKKAHIVENVRGLSKRGEKGRELNVFVFLASDAFGTNNINMDTIATYGVKLMAESFVLRGR